MGQMFVKPMSSAQKKAIEERKKRIELEKQLKEEQSKSKKRAAK